MYKLIAAIIIYIISLCSVFSQGWRSFPLEGEGLNYYEIVDEMEAYYENKYKGKGSGYKQFKRWAIQNESNFYPDGNIFNYKQTELNSLKKYQKQHPEVFTPQRATNGHWVKLGPYEWTNGFSSSGGLGRVNCIGFHPTNNNIFYVGTPSGGLWRTTNGGGGWICLTDGLPSIGVSSIVVHPSNPNIIYILTGDGDAGETPSIGVLVSYDAGLTWEQTGLSWTDSDYIRGYKMQMDPNNSNKLLVVGTNGIHRTIDGANSWDQVENIGTWTDVEFHPTNSNIIYAARVSGIYRSVNGGSDFIEMTDPDIDNLVNPTDFHRIALAVTPSQPNYLYALYGGGVTGFAGIFLSTNDGASFHKRSDSPNILSFTSAGTDSSHQASYDLSLDVNPNSASNVFFGGINVWKSENHATNWTLKSEWGSVNSSVGFTHADIHNINYRGSDIFVCSDGGIFKSTNDGEDWIDLTGGMSITMIYDFDVYNNQIVCGTQDNGSMRWYTTDADLEATNMFGGDGFENMIDPSSPNTLYSGSQNNRARSTNGGNSWCDITPPIAGCSFNENDHGGQWDASMVMHPNNFDTIYSATQTLYRSYNRGTTWSNLNAPFPSNGPTIRALAQGKNNPNFMYASNRLSIYVTGNLNTSNPSDVVWANISNNLPFNLAQLGGIAVDPNNTSRVWVSFLGYDANVKVFRSGNGGASWTNQTGGLPNVPARCIYFEPGSNEGIYVGTSIGVFYKNNNMSDWTYFSNGLPNVPVNDIDMDNGYLYVATWGRGVWRTTPYSACPGAYMLNVLNDPSNGFHTGTQVYQASNYIASERKVSGGRGTNVTYQAGNWVRMDQGFEVKAHSTFEAKVGGCQ